MFVECVLVIGGVLVILGVAVDLTNYLVGSCAGDNLRSVAEDGIAGHLPFMIS